MNPKNPMKLALAGVAGFMAAVLLAVAPASAAEGPSLPPAEYKPLPVGTKVRYNNWEYEVQRSDGFETVIKTNRLNWFRPYAVFGRQGESRYTLRVTSAWDQYTWNTDFVFIIKRNLFRPSWHFIKIYP